MNFRMELRSRRSKSKTPVVQTVIESESKNSENHGLITKTVTSTTVTKTSYSDVYPNESIDYDISGIDKSAEGWKSVKNVQYKSSSHSDDEVSSTNIINQNVSNQILEDSQHSFSSTGSSISALDVYRAAGDYWNKYPKTDYTYSLHSKDRKEIAPGVVAMPNMSRRSLHSYSELRDYHTSNNNKTTSKESFLQDEVDYSTRTSSWLTSAIKVQPRTLFSNNYYEESSYKQKSKNVVRTTLFRRIATFFRSVLVTVLTCFYVVYQIQNSIFMWFGKKIHKAATHVMIWDTWLLQCVSRKRKLTSILALCFIPLLLFGGWWLLYGLGPTILGADYTTSKSLLHTSLHENHNTETIQQGSEHNIRTLAEQVTAKLTSEQIEQVTKLLENPSIQDILSKNKHIKFMEDSNYEQTAVNEDLLVNSLKEEILKIRLELQNLEKTKSSEFDLLAAQLRAENAQKIALLTYQLNRCCRSSYNQIETYVARILKDLLGAPHYLSTPEDISKWLHSTFVAKYDLETHLSNLTKHLQSDYSRLIEDNGKLIMETVTSKILTELHNRIDKIQRHEIVGDLNVDSLTDEHIKKIVQDTLAIYDADKTGLVDYALETAGGQILSTRCTENYHARTAVFSLFGIPLWYLGNTPRTVIMPGVTPGECWAFQNFPGFLVIKLASPVQIEAFSLEHISKMLAPNGKIDSAPKEFSVHGLKNETDKEPVLLGRYKYDSEGPPLQYFAAEVHGLVFNIIELRIHSNHGNPNYTCLYRFRVHGILSNEPT